jgi:pentapeptide repeat protein
VGLSELSQVDFGGSSLTDVWFTRSDMNEVRFADATLTNVYLTRVTQSGWIDFEEAVLSNVRLPPAMKLGPPYELRSDRGWYGPIESEQQDAHDESSG